MQILLQNILTELPSGVNSNKNLLTTTKSKEQGMDFMQLLQLLTTNQELIQQAAGQNNYWYNLNTEADEIAGNKVPLENCSNTNQDEIMNFNPELMQLLQFMISNQIDHPPLADLTYGNNNYAGNDDMQFNYVAAGSETNTAQGVALSPSPGLMQLLQDVLANVDVQNPNALNQEAVNQALKQYPILSGAMGLTSAGYHPDLLLDIQTADILNQPLSTAGDLPWVLQKGIGFANVLPLAQVSNQVDIANELKQTNRNHPLINDPLFDNDLELYLNGKLETVGKTKQASDGAEKIESVNLPKQNYLNGLIKANLKAPDSNPIQLDVEAQPDNLIKGLPKQGMAVSQQGNAAISGFDTFTLKPSDEGIIQQLRVNDSSFVTRFAEIIKGHVTKDSAGQTHIKLQLQPENLGQVLIKLVFKDGNISTQFHATTEHARQLIENSLPQLRETLASFQINLQNTSVTVGGESGGNSKWGRDWNQGGNNNSRRSQLKDKSDDVIEFEGLPKSENILKRSQLNYFA